MTIRSHTSQTRLTELMLSQTLKGVVQFMEIFGWVRAKFTALDDVLRIVGAGILGVYHPK